MVTLAPLSPYPRRDAGECVIESDSGRPGSFGFRSLQALVQNDVLTGIETGFSMALIAMLLVTGLFLSNLNVAQRRLL